MLIVREMIPNLRSLGDKRNITDINIEASKLIQQIKIDLLAAITSLNGIRLPQS